MKDEAPPNKPMAVIILPKNQKYVSSTLILNVLLSFVMKKLLVSFCVSFRLVFAFQLLLLETLITTCKDIIWRYFRKTLSPTSIICFVSMYS